MRCKRSWALGGSNEVEAAAGLVCRGMSRDDEASEGGGPVLQAVLQRCITEACLTVCGVQASGEDEFSPRRLSFRVRHDTRHSDDGRRTRRLP